jgi:hypothetical protein
MHISYKKQKLHFHHTLKIQKQMVNVYHNKFTIIYYDLTKISNKKNFFFGF